MADKSFGVKDINLIGASGTPEIESPNNLNINAVNVAISTDMSVGGKISLGAGTSISSPGTNVLTLGTNSVERVRLTSDGSIGTKGLTPSDGSFCVNSTIRSQNSSSNISYMGFTGYTGNSTVGSMFSYMGGDGRNTGYLNFSTNDTERLRIDSSGRIGINTNTFNDAAEALRVQAPSGQSNTHLTIKAGSTSGYSVLNFGDNDFNEGRIKYNHSDNSMQFFTDDSERLSINSSGNVVATGSISDSMGSLRDIPLNDQSTNASYTLSISDAGKLVHASGTTSTVVVPSGVFGAGNVVTILNGNGSSNITISQGSGFSLRNTADGSSGNRTLAQFGMATIYFTGSNVGYISGSNMT